MAAAQRRMNRARRRAVAPATAFAVGLALAGCTPPLDWRDVRPEGSGLLLQMPCRPSVVERSLVLAGAAQRGVLYSCAADGMTWGLVFADVEEPAQVGPVLQAWREAAAANVATTPPDAEALRVPGATPSAMTGRLRLQGRRPDGERVQMQLALFTRGTLVFQATVLGQQVPAQVADDFFASLRFPP